MKMFKRLICVVLSIVLVMGSVVISTAFAKENNLEAMKTIDLFRSLGVIPDYYDYNIDMGKEMTRADFAYAAFNLVCPQGYKASQVYYYDVPQNYWAYDAISYLTEQGILHGSDEKIFEPDAPIEQAAAFKIMITLMGYGDFAAYNGGYPSGYLKVANRLGISDGCSSSVNLTMSDMLLILFQSAVCEIYEPESFGTDYSIYSVSEDKTLFSVYRNLYYQTGIVEGAEFTSVGSIGLYEKEDVLIGGVIYDSDVSLYDYIGEEVDILYNYDKATDKKTVVWAYRTGNTNVVNLEIDNDASFQDGEFVLKHYGDNDTEQTYRLDKNIRMIFNGGDTTRSVAEIFSLPRYEVKLVGTKSLYEIALVKVPELLIAGNKNVSEELVYDKINPGRSISMRPENYEYLKATLMNKEEIDFEDVVDGNVLSIYASEDGKRMQINVSNVTATGIVSQISKRDNGTVYVIAGVEYYQPYSDNNKDFSPGDNVTLYLDVKGEVAYIQTGIGTEYAAFLIKAALTDASFNQTLKIHLMGQEGNIDDKLCAEKMVVDGVRCKDLETAYRALCGPDGKFLPQIALISYNSAGEITSIDTATKSAEETEYTLSVNIPYKTDQLYKWFYQIGSMSPVNANTVFFSVPDDDEIATAEDDDFMTLKLSDFVNDSYHSLITYKSVPKSEIEQYVVLKGSSSNELRFSDNPMMVIGVGEALDSDGMQVECLEAYDGTEKVNIPAEDGFSLTALGIDEGDIVRVRKDANGEIVNAEVLVEFNELDTAVSTTSSFNSGYRLVVGYVHDIVGTVIKIGEEDPAVPTHITYGTGIPVIIYDADDREPIRIGELNDANTWYNAGSGCSRAVLLTKTGSPQRLFIYQK